MYIYIYSFMHAYLNVWSDAGSLGKFVSLGTGYRGEVTIEADRLERTNCPRRNWAEAE